MLCVLVRTDKHSQRAKHVCSPRVGSPQSTTPRQSKVRLPVQSKMALRMNHIFTTWQVFAPGTDMAVHKGYDWRLHYCCTLYPTFLNSRPSWISVGGRGYFSFGGFESSMPGVAGDGVERVGLPADLTATGCGVLHSGSCSASSQSLSTSSVAHTSCLSISRSFMSAISRPIYACMLSENGEVTSIYNLGTRLDMHYK
jgi:hypothetical protein